ncbi:peptidoglycan editing factor PgeF [Bacillaceae bacterium W0354]
MDDLFKNDQQLLKIIGWEEAGVLAGFSTRQYGVSEAPFDSLNVALHVNDSKDAVIRNRELVSEWLNRPLKDWFCINQIHSNKIIDLSDIDHQQSFYHDNPQINADGFITNHPKHLLVTFFADCVPLYFKSKSNDWIGLAHAGWRGTVNKIGPNMIDFFKNKGIEASNIEVVIGPCISAKHYEVDENVIQNIPIQYHNDVLKQTRPGHYLLDLKRLNRLFLVDAGVKDKNIKATDYCTFEEQQLFFSHRRDQGKTGRMLAYICLKNE